MSCPSTRLLSVGLMSYPCITRFWLTEKFVLEGAKVNVSLTAQQWKYCIISIFYGEIHLHKCNIRWWNTGTNEALSTEVVLEYLEIKSSVLYPFLWGTDLKYPWVWLVQCIWPTTRTSVFSAGHCGWVDVNWLCQRLPWGTWNKWLHLCIAFPSI